MKSAIHRRECLGQIAHVHGRAGIGIVTGGGGDAIITTPYTALKSVPVLVTNDNTGALMTGNTVANTSQIRIRKSDATTPVASGSGFSWNADFEIKP